MLQHDENRSIRREVFLIKLFMGEVIVFTLSLFFSLFLPELRVLQIVFYVISIAIMTLIPFATLSAFNVSISVSKSVLLQEKNVIISRCFIVTGAISLSFFGLLLIYSYSTSILSSILVELSLFILFLLSVVFTIVGFVRLVLRFRDKFSADNSTR